MTTDTQLQTNVLDELKWRPSVNAAHICVTAKHGVVTLTGQVAHYAEKSAAEEAAKGVYGASPTTSLSNCSARSSAPTRTWPRRH